jgi:mRNA deadenylase 3'-5' endonuclease subunit Ccr4
MSAASNQRLKHRLRVITWNILADGISMRQHGDSARPEYLKWDYRSSLIEKFISQMRPELVMLQEVDHYDDFFKPLFNKRNMLSIFFQRPQRPDGMKILLLS